MHKSLKAVCLTTLIALPWFSTISFAAELSIRVEAYKQRPTDGLVIELVGAGTAPAARGEFEINQLDKEFIPLLTIAGVGSSLSFTNQDELKHHIYSVSQANKFDLPLHNGRSEKIIQLSKPGVIKLGCNIHDWMLAYVYVAESDHVKIMDNSGVVTFDDLPAGAYQIKIWSPRLRNTKKPVIQAVTLSEGQAQTTSIKIKLRKHIRKPVRNEQAQSYDGDG